MKLDELHQLLGKGTEHAQGFEVATGRVLATVLHIETETGLRIAFRLGTASTLDLIRDLTSRKSRGINPMKIDHWLRIARQANAARNRIIHDRWISDEKKENLIGIINKDVGVEWRDAKQLKSDVDLLWRAVEETEKMFGTKAIRVKTERGKAK